MKQRKKQTRTPSRIGKRAVTVWVDEGQYESLKEAARSADMTLEAVAKERLFQDSHEARQAFRSADIALDGASKEGMFQVEGVDLADMSREELADLAGDALTEMVRQNPLVRLLSWDMDKVTITVRVAHEDADFMMLRLGPERDIMADCAALLDGGF
jgi:hypothetical protein